MIQGIPSHGEPRQFERLAGSNDGVKRCCTYALSIIITSQAGSHTMHIELPLPTMVYLLFFTLPESMQLDTSRA